MNDLGGVGSLLTVELFLCLPLPTYLQAGEIMYGQLASIGTTLYKLVVWS